MRDRELVCLKEFFGSSNAINCTGLKIRNAWPDLQDKTKGV